MGLKRQLVEYLIAGFKAGPRRSGTSVSGHRDGSARRLQEGQREAEVAWGHPRWFPADSGLSYAAGNPRVVKWEAGASAACPRLHSDKYGVAPPPFSN